MADHEDEEPPPWNSLPEDPRDKAQEPPHAIEAEQMLLGLLLYHENGIEYVPDGLTPAHFYEPFHGRLFDAFLDAARKGVMTDWAILCSRFEPDPGFHELGGAGYLSNLLDRAEGPAQMAGQYGATIMDMKLRRQMLDVAGIMVANVRGARGVPAVQQIEEIEQALFSLTAVRGQKGLTGFADVLAGSIEMAAAAFMRDGSLAGLSTGLMDLDRKLGGLAPSDLVILAGRPSMGKTGLATNIAFHTARTYAFEQQDDGSRKTTTGGVVAFFSLEMSGEQLGLRILADQAAISADRIRKGEVDVSEFARLRDAALEIQESPLYIDATGGLSIAALTTRCRRLKRTVGLDLVVVDYLQLVTVEGDPNPQQRIALVTQGLKALAKDLNVAVLALSQVSRNVENRDDKRPQLSDLRESGAIEQDADAVLFVYREHYYLERNPPKEGSPEHLTWEEECDKVRHVAEIIIGKQRHGPIGTVKVAFSGDTTKFSNLAREAY